MRKAEIRGQYLKKKLKILSSKHKTFGDLRGSGLLMAIELVSEKKSKSIFPPGFYPTEKIRICGLKNGLIIYSRKTANSVNGDWFIVAPPLTITEKECDELLERLKNDSVICAEGFLFEAERRGYLASGEFVPELALENPEALMNIHKDF